MSSATTPRHGELAPALEARPAVELSAPPVTDHASGTRHLGDARFIELMEGAALGGDEFRHFDHVRLAWLFLREEPLEPATAHMVRVIRAFAIRHTGSDARYHDTLTRLWMRFVANAMNDGHAHETFDAFVARHEYLLDKRYSLAFYTESRLMSAEARAAWVEPDLRSLGS